MDQVRPREPFWRTLASSNPEEGWVILMGDAADDMFNQFMQEEEKRYTLRKACTCGKQLWYRTKEGFWKCKGCKVEVDL